MKQLLSASALGGGIAGALDIGWRPVSPAGIARGLLPHVLFVGPVIAWAAARAEKGDRSIFGK